MNAMSKKYGPKDPIKPSRQSHQAHSLNLTGTFHKKVNSTINESPGPQTIEFKFHVFRAEINPNIGIQDLSPVITIKFGKEVKKTKTDSYRDPYNAVFNEVKII